MTSNRPTGPIRSPAIRALVTRTVVAIATLLLLGTVLVGLAPDELPSLVPQPVLGPTATPLPAPDLNIREQDVTLSQPLAEGVPFTATVTVHNLGELAAERIQLLFSIVRITGANEQTIVVDTATAGPIAARSTAIVPVLIPPVVALVPGQYRYQASANIVHGSPDRDLRNNAAPAGVFALGPPLAHCSGPVDLTVGRQDVVVQGQIINITVHNEGPRTLYNVQLHVQALDGIANLDHFYHLARLLPCGGTATVAAYRAAGKLLVEVNPLNGSPVVPEMNHGNNRVIVSSVAGP